MTQIATLRRFGFSAIDSLEKNIVPESIFSYVLAVQVSNIENVPMDMISFILPEHDYIFYKHVGPMKDYPKSLNEVFMYNLEEHNLEMDILPSFNIFPSDIHDDDFLNVEMLFPVSAIDKN